MSPDSDQLPRPPFVAVANHGTFFDPWIIGVYSPYPLSYMVNDDGFRGKSISSWYLRNIGAIPKKKGASDYRAMKTAISLLHQKFPVFIFPEGQTSWDGETQPLYRGLEKIVKKVKCPLVMVKFQGNFLTKPWWAKKIRQGSILINMKVLTESDVDTMTTDEIFNTLKKYIYQNDIKDPRNKTVVFKGDHCAEGLELFVWICMHCHNEDSISTQGNTITCTHCNQSWEIDAYCKLSSTTSATTLDDLYEWSLMHKKEVIYRIGQQPAILTKSENITMSKENDNHEFDDIATGTLTLTPDTLTFTSPEEQHSWTISSIRDYVIQKKNIFEFGSDNQTFRFAFDGKSPMKWIYYLRYVNNFGECEEQGYF